MAACLCVARQPGCRRKAEPRRRAGPKRLCISVVDAERSEDRIFRKALPAGPKNRLRRGLYTGRGREAISVGAGLTATPRTFLFPLSPGHGLFVLHPGFHSARDPGQYMGRRSAASLTAQDGNMHGWATVRQRARSPSARSRLASGAGGRGAGAEIPGGAANCAYVIFGDAPNQPWCELVTRASTWRAGAEGSRWWLICNTTPSLSTPIEKQMACAKVADRGRAYGIPPRSSRATTSSRLSSRRGAERTCLAGPWVRTWVECKTSA